MRMFPPLNLVPFCALFRLEVHSHAVDAIAQMRRRRAVFENVPEVTAAAAAMHFGADHAVARIGRRLHRAGIRIVEARPAGAAFELGLRDEELLSATRAIKRPGTLFVIQRTAPGPLGA